MEIGDVIEVEGKLYLIVSDDERTEITSCQSCSYLINRISGCKEISKIHDCNGNKSYNPYFHFIKL